MELDGSLWRFLLAFFLPVREIKIGVAKSTEQRQKTVDAGIKGYVKILNSYTVDAATRTESHLHELYKKQRFTVRGGKRSSGKTEFFRLSNKDISHIKQILKKRSKKYQQFRKVLTLICFLFLLLWWLVENQ